MNDSKAEKGGGHSEFLVLCFRYTALCGSKFAALSLHLLEKHCQFSNFFSLSTVSTLNLLDFTGSSTVRNEISSVLLVQIGHKLELSVTLLPQLVLTCRFECLKFICELVF